MSSILLDIFFCLNKQGYVFGSEIQYFISDENTIHCVLNNFLQIYLKVAYDLSINIYVTDLFYKTIVNGDSMAKNFKHAFLEEEEEEFFCRHSGAISFKT